MRSLLANGGIIFLAAILIYIAWQFGKPPADD